MTRWAGALVAVVVVLLSVPMMALVLTPPPCAGTVVGAVSTNPVTPQGGFPAEALGIARAAAAQATARHLSARALVVIFAAGYQESEMRNLSYGDRDSLGWLQQRANWGSVADRMNPGVAAGKFFDVLVGVPGWAGLPVTVAAQRVQVSAYPDAYAKWESQATALAGLVAGNSSLQPGNDCASTAAGGGGPVPGSFNQQGNPRTVEQAITFYEAHMPNGGSIPVHDGCERWTNLAYGRPGGYATALAHWNAPGARSMGMSTPPPRGALVFWQTSNPAGHVAISLGNGVVISTDFDGTRYSAGRLSAGPIGAIDRWGNRLGWRAPGWNSAA